MRKLLVLAAAAYSFSAHAYFQMDFLKSKNSAAKTSSQWTLADWLTQRSKAKLADQWLAMNRSTGSLLEVNLGGGYNDYKVKTGPAAAAVTQNSQSYSLDTYISFVNLMAEYEKTNNDRESKAAALGVRLLGSSSQTTNLVLRGGMRELKATDTGETWKNTFAEGALQLYLVSFFGLNGKYRHYFPNESGSGNKLAGHRATAGAFLEIGVLRLYGDYYQEPLELTPAGTTVPVKTDRTGIEYGAKLFF